MINKFRNSIIEFFENKKYSALFAIMVSGLYPFLYYYDKNYAFVNSKKHFIFFIIVYFLTPIVSYSIVLGIMKLNNIKKERLILSSVNMFFFGALIGVTISGFNLKLILILGIIGLILGIILNQYFVNIMIFQFLLSGLALIKLIPNLYREIVYSKDWMRQTDDILSVKFETHPNIYFIQPDGYANPLDLKDSIYKIDNSEFNSYLKRNDFKIYNGFRSNYSQTLSSNSSLFSMRHHYYGNNDLGLDQAHNARNEIVEKNPVLQIFKRNGYRTFLMLEVPYLIANKPDVFFDYSNIDVDDLPYLSQGFDFDKDLFADTKRAIINNKETHNFFFIETMLPGHITNHNSGNTAFDERNEYINDLQKANLWLIELIDTINELDPEGIVIIAGDHGGYVGFNSTDESLKKVDDPLLIRSIFSSMLAIKWPNQEHDFDKNLKTSVNLFRILFSYLSNNKSYLDHLQKDSSYIFLKEGLSTNVYEYINTKGNVVFNKF